MSATITFPDAPDVELHVRRLELDEPMSAPFSLLVRTRSTVGDIDLEGLVGARAVVTFERGDLGSRTLTGVCTRVQQREGAEGATTQGDVFHRYDVLVEPRLALADRRVNRRIFQHASAPEIAAQVLAAWGVSVDDRLKSAYPKLEYRVQHGESDLAFARRLLEESGISWIATGDAIVLDDRPEAADPRAAVPYVGQPSRSTAEPYVTAIQVGSAVKTGKTTIAAFDWRRPRGAIPFHATDAGTTEGDLEHFVYAPGAGLIDMDHADDATPAADDQSAARHDEEVGYTLAKTMLAGLRGPRRDVSFTTNRADLAAGVAMTVSGAPPMLGEGRVVVTRARVRFDTDEGWDASVEAAPCTGRVLPRVATPRPRALGVVTAFVVGPPGEEIYTDEQGRVRVRFPWDRGDVQDDHRTCWLRVSESWAGAAFGAIATPRVGDEVIVAFYEGDPDMPVVVGRVHNVAAPTPNPLPASAARTVWRTRSTPSSDGYHELAFEDRKGRELISLRSERDLEKNVQKDEVESTGNDQVILVGTHLSTTIATDDTVAAGYKHAVTWGLGGEAAIATDTRRELIDKRITLTTGGATIVLDGPEITITSEKDIHIGAEGTVFIHGGPQVHINPPVEGVIGDPKPAELPPDKVVWFQLHDEAGAPLAGVRCYVELGDGTTSAPQVTGADGGVRFAVSKDGPYEIKLGKPSATNEGGAS